MHSHNTYIVRTQDFPTLTAIGSLHYLNITEISRLSKMQLDVGSETTLRVAHVTDNRQMGRCTG